MRTFQGALPGYALYIAFVFSIALLVRRCNNRCRGRMSGLATSILVLFTPMTTFKPNQFLHPIHFTFNSQNFMTAASQCLAQRPLSHHPCTARCRALKRASAPRREWNDPAMSAAEVAPEIRMMRRWKEEGWGLTFAIGEDYPALLIAIRSNCRTNGTSNNDRCCPACPTTSSVVLVSVSPSLAASFG
jgi:hypothetical protein